MQLPVGVASFAGVIKACIRKKSLRANLAPVFLTETPSL